MLTLPQQCGDRDAEELSQQIEQRGLDRGDCMHGDAHIKGLQATAACITVAEASPHGLQNLEVRSDGAADDHGIGIFEDLADVGAAWDLAGAGMPRIVGQQYHIAGEVRRMGSAQVEQHTVAARNRDHAHVGYTR